MRLARYPEKHVLLACIKFMRVVIGAHDDFYNRWIVRNHALSSVVAVALRMEGRDNLVTAAVIDLMQCIGSMSSKLLIDNLMDKYEPALQAVSTGTC